MLGLVSCELRNPVHSKFSKYAVYAGYWILHLSLCLSGIIWQFSFNTIRSNYHLSRYFFTFPFRLSSIILQYIPIMIEVAWIVEIDQSIFLKEISPGFFCIQTYKAVNLLYFSLHLVLIKENLQPSNARSLVH